MKESFVPHFVPALAVACALTLTQTGRAQFASSVISYNAGSGTTAAYQDPTRSLGAPTTFIGYQDADPFNPAYSASHLVSVGAGGSLTLAFNQPIFNTSHAFGLDFNIFGNTGFIITNSTDENWNYIGTPATDGSLFAANEGVTRVSVSSDGLNFFTLNPLLAPTVDTLFPSDTAGDFRVPVNPGLNNGSFAGLDLAGIRALYAGSGGGAGYDISWAQDGFGNSVALGSISFVRIEVLSGKAEIDALVAVPEPTTLSLAFFGISALIIARRSRA
jgi:hypothetical protein